MDKWQAEFADAQERLPCWLSRLARPRIFFLPRWWPAPVGAWAYLHMVFIGPGLRDAPDDVRRYIVGHEYGHIQANHTLLHFFYWLGALAFVGASGKEAVAEARRYMDQYGETWPAEWLRNHASPEWADYWMRVQ